MRKVHKKAEDCSCGHHAECGAGDTPDAKIEKSEDWTQVNCKVCLKKRKKS